MFRKRCEHTGAREHTGALMGNSNCMKIAAGDTRSFEVIAEEPASIKCTVGREDTQTRYRRFRLIAAELTGKNGHLILPTLTLNTGIGFSGS